MRRARVSSAWMGAAALLAGAALPARANPLPGPMGQSVYPGGVPPELFPLVVVLDAAADLFFLTLGLLVVRRLAEVPASRIAALALGTVIVGFAADSAGVAIGHACMGEEVWGEGFPPFVLLAGLVVPAPLILIANGALIRWRLRIPWSAALRAAAVVAAGTTPLLYLALMALSGRHEGFAWASAPVARAIVPLAVGGAGFAVGSVLLLRLAKGRLGWAKVAVWSVASLAAVAALSAAGGPELVREQQRYETVLCLTNLKQLAVGVLTTMERTGRAPARLEDLPPDALPNRAALRCPAAPEGGPACTYQYTPAATGEADPANAVMIRCPHHRGYGAEPCAFVDGHAKVLHP